MSIVLEADQKPISTMENVIVGVGLGGVLAGWAFYAQRTGHLPHFSPTVETFFLAALLTAVVAWIPFRIPTPFTSTNPWLAQVTLGVLSGVVSLFFDSFAVVLLVAKITTYPATGVEKGRHTFNDFAFRTVASFNALTVGGAFYIGELWGLPYYISSGMDTWWTGIPLLPIVVIYALFTSVWAATYFPIQFDTDEEGEGRLLASFEMVAILTLIIVSHNTPLSAGVLLLWSALVRRDTGGLIAKTAHEVHEGGANALALIMIAIVVQQIPGSTELVASFTANGEGAGTVMLAALSSPFAGAMLPPAENPAQFYQGLINLMVGAPLFVSSSLVAIMVFKSHVAWKDIPLPSALRDLRVSENVAESILYTVIAAPLALGLYAVLMLGMNSGLVMGIYNAIAPS